MSRATTPIERQQALRSLTEALHSSTIDAVPHLDLLEIYVREHRRWSVDHEEIADRAGIRPSKFSALFHAHVGMSFSRWMTQVRIKHALEMLGHRDLAIDEIGKLVGYNDCGTFRRAFKRVTGFLPSEVREILKPGTIDIVNPTNLVS